MAVKATLHSFSKHLFLFSLQDHPSTPPTFLSQLTDCHSKWKRMSSRLFSTFTHAPRWLIHFQSSQCCTNPYFSNLSLQPRRFRNHSNMNLTSSHTYFIDNSNLTSVRLNSSYSIQNLLSPTVWELSWEIATPTFFIFRANPWANFHLSLQPEFSHCSLPSIGSIMDQVTSLLHHCNRQARGSQEPLSMSL